MVKPKKAKGEKKSAVVQMEPALVETEAAQPVPAAEPAPAPRSRMSGAQLAARLRQQRRAQRLAEKGY